MALTRIHHVSQIAPDFDQAQHVYVDGMGLAVDLHRSPLPDGRPGDLEGTRALEFPIGEMFIEVSCPSPGGDSLVRQFLAERNDVGGMHHVAFASTDLQNDVQDLERKGLRFLAHPGGSGPLLVDPEMTMGLLIEIIADDHYYTHPMYRGDGVATGMAHIGIAARSEEEITDLFTGKFGFAADERAGRSAGTATPARSQQPPREADDDVSIVEFPFGGTVIEVSVPNDDVSGTARFLATRGALGAAWHHICPFAPDVHEFMDRGNAAGMRQLGSIPPRDVDARAVGWFHPRSALGTLIEVWNRAPNHP